MTDKVLKNSGYKKITVNPVLFPHGEECFTKIVRDRLKRVKYIIYVVGYIINDNIEYEYNLFCGTYYGRIHLNLNNIKLPLTIEEIEQEIDKIWTRGDFNYYES